MIIPLFIIITTTAFSQDKIYTNEDLKAEPPTHSNSTPHIQTFMKRSDFNPSFTELHKYVEDKLTEIRIPQYKVYLRPLSLGMTEENVRQIWQFGTITDDAGLQERNANKTATSAIATVNYAIGVSLYFENNRLKGWRIYNQPRFTISKDAKVVNYQNLKKNESVPGLKESPAFDLPKYEPSPPPLSQLEVPHNSVQIPMQQYVQQHQTENDLMAKACGIVTSFLFFVIVLPFVIWLVALIDILRNEFTGNNKIIWFLAATFLPLLGPILYFFIGTDQKLKRSDEDDDKPLRLI